MVWLLGFVFSGFGVRGIRICVVLVLGFPFLWFWILGLRGPK